MSTLWHTVCPRLKHQKPLLLTSILRGATLVSERKIIKPTQQPHVLLRLLGKKKFRIYDSSAQGHSFAVLHRKPTQKLTPSWEINFPKKRWRVSWESSNYHLKRKYLKSRLTAKDFYLQPFLKHFFILTE